MRQSPQKPSVPSPVTVPSGLYSAVMDRIEAEKQARQARRRLFMALCVAPVIVALAVPVWRTFAADMVRSGFWQYFSLAFTDFRAVMADWQDFGLGLLESLPVLSTVAFLAIVLGGLVVTKYILQYRKYYFSLS